VFKWLGYAYLRIKRVTRQVAIAGIVNQTRHKQHYDSTMSTQPAISYNSAAASSAAPVVFSACAMRHTLRSVKFFSPRSTAPMYVRCSPHSNDNASCDKPAVTRACRIAIPNRFSGARRLSMTPLNKIAAYQSTLY
jgi:hypothetical protein